MAQAGTAVRHLLARRDFCRLLATRLVSQFGDGVLQAALAGTVLFNPQRAADPLDVAAGFAVLLLPYSLVGPFAGVLLDRWSRRQVLLLANAGRAVLVVLLAALVWSGVSGAAFYLTGLVVFSVSRFVLAALSAALPHTTDQRSLVPANALSTTSGAVATIAGGGLAITLLQLGGAGNDAYAGMTLAAALPYLAAAAVVAGFGRRYLGPDSVAGASARSLRAVAAGMVAGARHARACPPAVAALTVITLQRLGYGVLTLMTLLLFRNALASWGPVPAGLPGLGIVVAAGAAGTLLAAGVTPWVVRHVGKPRWMTLLLGGGGVVLVGLGLPYAAPTAVLTGLVLGFTGQGVKICVDATLQESIDDDFRGRVFSVYDTLVNVAYVLALVLAALLLPASGVSYPVLGAVGVVYLLAAVCAEAIPRRGRHGTPPLP